MNEAVLDLYRLPYFYVRTCNFSTEWRLSDEGCFHDCMWNEHCKGPCPYKEKELIE